MERHREQPFFLYFPMALCHAVSDDFMPRPPYEPGKNRYENYAEMMAAMDERIGQLVGAVEKLGLAKKTLVLFLTDNGTTPHIFIRHDNGRLIKERVTSRFDGREVLGAKGKFTDLGIRVPAIAWWPGRIKPGQTSDALIDVSDLLPTFVELAGRSGPSFKTDGRSFAGLLTGDPHTSREWVSVQTRNKACVRTRDWKLVSDGRLFQLAKDPDEKKAIAAKSDTPESKAARKELAEILKPIVSGLK
ncbi:MAG: sulfatase-like hydrolase/transferase [Verrucomicrobiota bacterium]